jgi:hypothetical protein
MRKGASAPFRFSRPVVKDPVLDSRRGSGRDHVPCATACIEDLRVLTKLRVPMLYDCADLRASTESTYSAMMSDFRKVELRDRLR